MNNIVEVIKKGSILIKNATNVIDVSQKDTTEVKQEHSLDREIKKIQSVDVYNPIARSYNPNNPFENPTPPPIITGLGGMIDGLTNVRLAWDSPNYTNHSHVEVWRGEENTVSTAILVGTSVGASYNDNPKVQTLFYYWVRSVSLAGVPGPFNSVSGYPLTSVSDPSELLSLLIGSLSESHLTNTLTAKLGGIDDNATAIGNESFLRSQAITNEIINRTNAIDAAISQEVTDREASIATWAALEIDERNAVVAAEANVRASETGALSAQYTVKIDVNGNVAGYGLASGPPQADGTESEFTVLADKISFIHPTDNNLPALSMTVLPTGVYMDAAYITNLTADKIKAGTISASIEMNALAFTGGSLNINNGQAIINSDGSADFKNIIARGDIEASSIKANVVDTDSIQANSISVDKLKIGSVTAEKVVSGSLSQFEKSTGTYSATITFDTSKGDNNSGLLFSGTIIGNYGTAGNEFGKLEATLEYRRYNGSWSSWINIETLKIFQGGYSPGDNSVNTLSANGGLSLVAGYTSYQIRLKNKIPSSTAYWESVSIQGIFAVR